MDDVSLRERLTSLFVKIFLEQGKDAAQAAFQNAIVEHKLKYFEALALKEDFLLKLNKLEHGS